MNKFAKIGSVLLIILGLVGIISDIIHTSIYTQIVLDFRMIVNILFYLIWVLLGSMILLNKYVRISFIITFILFVFIGLYNYVWIYIHTSSSFPYPWLPILNIVFGTSVLFISLFGELRQREALLNWRNKLLFSSLSYLVFGYIGWVIFSFFFTVFDVTTYVRRVFDPTLPLEGNNLGVLLYLITFIVIYICQILSGGLLFNELRRDEKDE